MSTEAQELLEELVKKISNLESSLNKIVEEKDSLRHMIKSMYIWQKGMADKLKKYETNQKTDSQSKTGSKQDET